MQHYRLLISGCFVAGLLAGCATPQRTAVTRRPAGEPRATNDSIKQDAPSPVVRSTAPSPEPGGATLRFVEHRSSQPDIEALPPAAGKVRRMAPVVVKTYPIDLPTALQLADAENLQVALAREQIRQAYAEYNQAEALWLPSLRGGLHWNKHEGTLQETNGNVLEVSRTSLYAGAGAQAIGAGPPMVPGLFANFHLADALFQPLAAEQRVGARQSNAAATRNNVLLSVSLAYLELLRAAEDVAIARDLHQKAGKLADLTAAYARSGQGLIADADRMRVELAMRANDIRRTEEALAVASARLAQLLRLDPCVRLEPIEPAIVPLELIACDAPCCELVAQGLSNRPELLEARYLVGEAIQRMRRERYAPLVPSLLLGASYGGFGGGLGDDVNQFNDRFDFDASAYWELRNLGYGEVAARQGTQSRMQQARIQQMALLDLVAREVAEAHAQVEYRRLQIESSRLAVQSALASHQQNLTRIEQAQGLPIEALQSMQALLQARREYLRSITDYNSAQFSLQRALGWPVRG